MTTPQDVLKGHTLGICTDCTIAGVVEGPCRHAQAGHHIGTGLRATRSGAGYAAPMGGTAANPGDAILRRLASKVASIVDSGAADLRAIEAQSAPTCPQCREEIPLLALGFAFCECGSGLCEGCCCGWDCLCWGCGSHDHQTDSIECPVPSENHYAAHDAWLAELAERRAQ